MCAACTYTEPVACVHACIRDRGRCGEREGDRNVDFDLHYVIGKKPSVYSLEASSADLGRAMRKKNGGGGGLPDIMRIQDKKTHV